MNARTNAAKALSALAAMGLALYFSIAVASSTTYDAPQMTLVATDTTVKYPVAAILVEHVTYHVFEGDKLFGLYVRTIRPRSVTLSNNATIRLAAGVAPSSAWTVFTDERLARR